MMIRSSLVFALLLGPPEQPEDVGPTAVPEAVAPATREPDTAEPPGAQPAPGPTIDPAELPDAERVLQDHLHNEKEKQISDRVDEAKRLEQETEASMGPRAGVDPLHSALATVPDVPVLDVLSTSVTVSSKDAFAKLTIAPFALIPWKRSEQSEKTGLSGLPELRFNISGDTSKGTFGFGGSWGYSTMAHNLWVQGFDELVSACTTKSFGGDTQAKLNSKTKELASYVTGHGGDLDENKRDDPSHVRTKWNWLRETLDHDKRVEGDKLFDELVVLHTTTLDNRATCIGDKLYRARMESAYKNAFGFHAEGGTTLFAIIDGPSLQDTPTCTDDVTTDCVEPGEETFSPVAPNRLQSVKVSAGLTYFASMRFGMWVTGSYERSRAEAADDDMSEIVSVGFTLAGLVAQGKIDKDGYVRGFALGASYQRSWCLPRETSDPTDMHALVPCKHSLLFYSDKGSMSYIDRIAPFFDLRVSSKLQARISLPVERIRLSSPLDNSDGGRTVIQFVPSISLGVASWGFNRG